MWRYRQRKVCNDAILGFSAIVTPYLINAGCNMNLDKAKKRIAKHIKKGFDGYPEITLTYIGSSDGATEVVVGFVMEAGATSQEQRFVSKQDVRQDETIQSVLVKIIERADAKTVTEMPGVNIIKTAS
jgi:hypothetical protein